MKQRYFALLILSILFTNYAFAQITLPLRQLDTTLLVGATTGSANVSPGGAATYSIPIFTSPGTAGLQPQISIEYNSQSPNGVLGTGFNIGGLSSITRVPKDYYHDKVQSDIALNDNDRFAWDGSRLVDSIGVYGAEGTVYYTENQSFAKIVSHYIAYNGTSSFTVTTKQGMTLTYGTTTDSRIEVPYHAQAIQWRLDQMTDPNGNYIKYYYIEISGDSYIDRIEYTGNNAAGILPYNTVKFTYENRPDISQFCLAGTCINQTKRLTGIDITSETVQVRHYTFSYLPFDPALKGFETSRLASIQESATLNGITKMLNPTVINWGAATGTQTVITNTTNTINEEILPLFGDLNGDGRTDEIILSKATGDLYYSHCYYYQSQGNSMVLKSFYGNYVPYKVNGGFIADMNNDGVNEIYLCRPPETRINCYPCNAPPKKLPSGDLTPDNSSNMTEKRGIYPHPNDTCCDPPQTYQDHAFMYHIKNERLESFYNVLDSIGPDNDKILIGNINSDGKTDRFRVDYYNNIVCNSVRGFTLSICPNFNSPDKVQLMDFDGDGRDEIFVLKAGEYKIYKYDQATSSFLILCSGSMSWATAKNYKTGDFNGDGKTDIVLHKVGLNKFAVFISYGTSFSYPIWTSYDPILCLPGNEETDIYVTDINGDGRDDILCFYSKLVICPAGIAKDGNDNLNGSPGFVKYYSDFKGTLTLFGFQKLDNAFTNTVPGVNIADIDGDGIKDAMLSLYPVNKYLTPIDNIVYYNYANKQRYRVNTIVNGINQAAGFTYISLATANTGKYTKGNSSVFPVNDIQPAQFVVATLTTHAGYMNSGSYVYSVTNFSYKGARTHLQGRGYLGFDTLVSVNNLSGVKTESVFGVDSNFYFRYPLAVNTYVQNTATAVKTFTFVSRQAGKGKYLSFPASEVVRDLLSGNTVTHAYIFDNFGNLTKDSATYGSDAVVTTTNAYITVGGTGVKNKLSSSFSSSVYKGQPAFSTKRTFGYDSRGNRKTVIAFADQAKPVTTTDSVNKVGVNIISTVSAAGMTPRINRTYYDAKYRMPVRSINPAGYKSAVTYNYALGIVLSDSAPNGLKATFGYDEFGRLKSTLVPEGYTITQSINWKRAADPVGTIYTSTTTTPGKPKVKSCFDISGRSIHAESSGFSNRTLFTDYSYVPATPYGKAGLLTSQTLPYYSGETPQLVKYTYDAYGRILEVNDRTMITKTSYSGMSVTSTDVNGIRSTKTLNATGNIVSATDVGGTIEYTYHSSGQPLKIKAAGAITSITYDVYGHQKTLIDPDAGTTSYTYDALGRLASQTNANNKKDTLQYDIIGRLVQKKTGSDITSYLYNTSGRAIGQPVSVTAGNGSKQEYAYDNFGRVNTVKQTIPGQTTPFTTSYTYDMYGNNTKIKYPEPGYAVLNSYDAQGRLIKVTDTLGATIWQLTDVSSHGLPLTTIMGNGLNTNYYYDMDQVTCITTGLSAVGTVQSESYGVCHPDIGNIDGRRDNIAGQNESFTYDNLNRLINILPNGFPAPPPGGLKSISNNLNDINNLMMAPIRPLLIEYSNNGNISNKYDGGAYAYDPTKIHAVTSVTKTAGTVQQQLQNIAYTTFNKADSISQTNNKTGKTLKYKITYGPDEQRVKTIFTDTLAGNPVTTRYYAGAYEKETTSTVTKQIHYIMGGTGLVAIYIKWPNTGKDTLYYICKDRQGSITALVRQDQSIAEKFSYDAWGRRRNPADWTDFNVKAPRLISRGYTGHEMLDAFGLINMNGRMYDPAIGRVLSPDNYVQDPTNTQSYNRYSYCMNNPLRYTDPSGWLTASAWAEYYENKVNAEFAWLEGMANNGSSRTSCGDGGGGGGGWSSGSWSDYLHDPRENFVMMSGRAYNKLYGQGTYENMQTDRNDPNFNGPDKYTRYGTGSFVVNQYGYWVFTGETTYVQVADYTVNKYVAKGEEFGNEQNKFSNSEKAALGIGATSGSVQVTTELINRLSGTVKNADIVNFGKAAGVKFGIFGVATTTYFAVSDGKLTTGDGARILLSGLTFIPYIGWSYGLIDMGTLLVTGTSVTDRIGLYIDKR